MRRSSVHIRLLLIFGVILLASIIFTRFSFRFDFTGDKRYTLSNATKDILKTIDDPVTITAYFSKELPPNIASTREEFKELLIEYVNASGNNVVYEFIDPSEDPEVEKKAQSEGIQPVMINVREKDQVKQQKAYLGATLRMGEQNDVIPFIQPGTAMEYSLSSSIKRLAVIDKPKIAFLQGHGEPTIEAMRQAVEVLSVLYKVEPYEIEDSVPIPLEYKTLAIVAPQDSISPIHLARLEEYASNGGRLYIGINKVNGDLSTSRGTSLNTGLEVWLSSKGIIVEDKFVIDANCGSVSVRQQQGFFTINTPVNFPYLPLISNFADHPIAKGLERVLFPFISPLTHSIQDTSVQITVLASSSAKSATTGANTYFDVMKQWNDGDFPLSNLPLGLAIEGSLFNDNISKLVVFGDGDFAVNGEGRAFQQLQPDNVSLMVNAIDWLSDDTGLIELRTKAVTSRPIKKQLEDGKKQFVKYANFLLPVLLILIYGFIRSQYRRRARAKWMEETYA